MKIRSVAPGVKQFFMWLIAAAGILIPVSTFAQNFDEYGEISYSYVDDSEFNGSMRIDFKYANEQFVQLSFPPGKEPKDRKPAFAHVTGIFSDNVLLGPSVEVSDIEIFPTLGTESLLSGSRTALVLRISFTDASPSCSANDMANHMWNGTRNVRGFFEESSFGQLTIANDGDNNGSVDVVDVNIGVAQGTSCNFSSWASLANSAAQGQGINLSRFQHRIYVLPSTVPCSWAGLGNVGCLGSCNSWTRRCDLVDVVPHELGHNFGLGHARTDTNDDGAAECEYCDGSSMMGYAGVGWRHFNAVQKNFLGWIPPERVRTVNSNGTYQLALQDLDPLDISPPPPTTDQILDIAVPNSSKHYYLSFRTQTGSTYNNNLSSTYRPKVSIHYGEGDSGTSYVSALAAGQSYTGNGLVNFSVSTIDNGHATVDISGLTGPINTPTPTPTATATRTATPIPTRSATRTPSSTPTPRATATPSANPPRQDPGQQTPTPTPQGSPTAKPKRGHDLRGSVRLSNRWNGKGVNLSAARLQIFRVTQRSARRTQVLPLQPDGSFASTLATGTYRLTVSIPGYRLGRSSKVVYLKRSMAGITFNPVPLGQTSRRR